MEREFKRIRLPKGMAYDHKCSTCGGTGWNICTRCRGEKVLNGNEKCYFCQGKGLIDCTACGGRGICAD